MRSFILLSLTAVILLCASIVAMCQPSAAQVQPQADGITVESNGVHLRVQALRPDVLRVRYWRGDAMPEDASWAVLPEARQSSTQVTKLQDQLGFSTSALQVRINSTDLRLTILDKDGKLVQQDAAPIEFRDHTFKLSQTMPLQAHYFGLGDKTGPFDRREETFTLWNTDTFGFQEATDPIYKAIPFFVTYEAGRAIGTLLDNTWRTNFDFGHTVPNTLTMGAANGPVDYYLLYGPSPKKVLAEYMWLTGPSPLPPLWSLGFQQSRYSYMTQDRVEEVVKRMRDDHIPADAIYLDIDYQDRNRPFTVNKQAFPDLPGMVKKLHSENMHLVAITDLHVANAPGQGYAPYDSGIAANAFVHNPDGSVYTGDVWPGKSVFPDFTDQNSRSWWGTQYHDFVGIGIDGFWNDMNEPSVFNVPTKTMPEDTVHRIDEPGFRTRTATHAEIHNVYGMENVRGTQDGLLNLRPNERPFVLTRAAYAGTQRYAATWTGDNTSSWNHLRLSTFMLKNLGLSGYSIVGADVGGFAGSPSPELLTKWIEIAAFQPIDRDHSEKGSADQEVWVHGPQQEAIRRRFIEERYRLLPYLYTTAEDNTRTGLPIVRPIFLEFPDATPDKHPMDVDLATANEFLFGPDLLVAPPPIMEQTFEYEAHLPGPGWYDYWTGKHVDAVMKVTPRLAELPVYVRPGAILPIAPLTQNTVEQPKGPLTLRVYAGSDCHGALYTDDGHTFAYRQGDYLRMQFTCEAANGGLSLHIGEHEGNYHPWWTQVRVEVYGLAAKSMTAKTKDRSVPAKRQGEALEFTVADDGHGMDLTLN